MHVCSGIHIICSTIKHYLKKKRCALFIGVKLVLKVWGEVGGGGGGGVPTGPSTTLAALVLNCKFGIHIKNGYVRPWCSNLYNGTIYDYIIFQLIIWSQLVKA